MTDKIITTDAELATALTVTNPGDTLQLSGVFRRPVLLTRGGEPDKPLRLTSVPGQWATFDFGQRSAQFVVVAKHVIVDNLQLMNGSAVRSLPEGHCGVWRNLRICGMVDQGLSIMGEDSIVEDCDLWLNGGIDTGQDHHSLYLAGARQIARRNRLGPCLFGSPLTTGGTAESLVITDNMICASTGYMATAVNLYGNNHLFQRNTVYHVGTGKAAVECYAGPRNVQVLDNTICASDWALWMYRTSQDVGPTTSIAKGNTIYGRYEGDTSNDFIKDNTINPPAHRWATWNMVGV
jgi:hypothetical protein